MLIVPCVVCGVVSVYLSEAGVSRRSGGIDTAKHHVWMQRVEDMVERGVRVAWCAALLANVAG